MNTTASKIIVAILAFVALNFLARQFFFRLDLTKNQEFTLSPATKNILRNLEEKVKVTAYFSDDLPTDVGKTKEELKEILDEFYNLSKGNLEYEFIAPNDDPKKEEEAMREGIQPVMINVREKDQAKQLKAFLGATIKVGDKKEIIPVIQPGTAMEYALTTNIKKLVVKNKPVIGFIQGHREASLQEMVQVYESLNILYSVESVYFTDSTDLSKYKTLVLVRPQDSFPPDHFQMLDEYLAQGGNLLIAANQIEAELQTGQVTPSMSGVGNWLATKGIVLENALIKDAACGSVQVQQQTGMFSFATPVQLPYLPLIQNFSNHPVTKGLERVILQFASAVSYNGKEQFTPLLFSSGKSGRDPMPIVIDIQRQWTEADFPERNICLGAVVEGKIAGTTSSKLVIYGDGDFPVGRGRNQQINQDNVSLLVNGIDWLTDDTGLIDLRTKAVETRPIKELDDATRNMYKYLNFLVPIILVLLYSFYRSSQNRRKRTQRMEERYN
ncbi:MAG: Gldg family protein [Saprospiraceae bacterium]|nr:Gldg family protein [Candidatus Vicinibacter affinis]MBP6172596.1 Gldg family protein [Saprospiraceae bacterium]MBK7799024.1 Gldg family protein [Candidatus Vicinibacter affinis]MBK9641019.1 Gldg family protein [Candidatus Vicinibacter affinis]MBP6522384.1 Gldg family protein [Saprospiraceae bacterium]